GRIRTPYTAATAIPFCHGDGITITASDSTPPSTSAAISAPTRLPMPPTMVIANALTVSGNPTAGYTLKSGAISAPDAPASATPSASVRPNTRPRAKPTDCATTGDSATARTAT